MIKNDDKKTTLKMRIIVAAIAVFMLGSSFALYASIVLNYSNNETAKSANKEKEDRFNELYEAYMKEVEEYTNKLSDKYFDEFVSYKSRVTAFNTADAQKELVKEDLKKGDGDKITYEYDDDGNVIGLNQEYSAYYIGWLSDETIFDSSFNDANNPSSLNEPLAGSTNLIQGWIEGVEGMRIGGVREITIPSTLAYGENESGSIPANSPLKFIIMVVDAGEEPQPSEELEQLYYQLFAQ